jgi:hypothetical protein
LEPRREGRKEAHDGGRTKRKGNAPWAGRVRRKETQGSGGNEKKEVLLVKIKQPKFPPSAW